MSKFQKALLRLKSRPKDFTWGELQTILTHMGYEELKGSGSRRKFINRKSGALVSLHEPHPGSIMKLYAIDIILEHLKEQSLL